MPELTARDRAIQARARAFVDEELIPWEIHAEMHEGEVPEDVSARILERARQDRLVAINHGPALGGPGYTTLQQALIQEQAGRATNALGWVVSTPAGWLPEVATPYQMERYVRPLVAGELHECYAITEEHAGSDVDAITTTATRRDDHYVLSGEKWHVTSANLADIVFVQAKLAHDGSHAMFIVDMDAPGVRHLRTPAYTHTYAHHHWEMAFDDVEVPADNLVGSEGDAMTFAHAWFRYERLMIAARCCGAAQRLIDEATAFATDRRAYGTPIIEYQSISNMLADSVTELWGARLMMLETADEMDRGADPKMVHAHCSMAKLAASEMAYRVADRAVQIFGGRGYMRENAAERFLRELRVDRIWEGTSEIQRVIIAAQLQKRGVERLT